MLSSPTFLKIIFIGFFCFFTLFFSWHTALHLVLGFVFFLVLTQSFDFVFGFFCLVVLLLFVLFGSVFVSFVCVCVFPAFCYSLFDFVFTLCLGFCLSLFLFNIFVIIF